MPETERASGMRVRRVQKIGTPVPARYWIEPLASVVTQLDRLLFAVPLSFYQLRPR